MMCYYLNVHFQGQRVKLYDCVLQRTCIMWGLFGDFVTLLYQIIRIGSEIIHDFIQVRLKNCEGDY
jgi:hypothetical protein